MSNDPSNDKTVTVPQRPVDPDATAHFTAAPQKTAGLVAGYRLGGNFRLEKQLGRGGMGEAWKAYDETADRFVVLKFVPKEIQHIQEAMDLVRDSFKKVHTLQHQHICPVYGLLNDSEYGLYVVMKFVDGVPLDTYKRRYIEKNGKISFSDIVQILWGIAQGLDYAHEKKIIHRDIKPQNVMIGKADGVQIIDFGLAEEIRTSMARFSQDTVMSAAGTRSYMAPEQWRGRLQDARTDQYALAVTAYEMFSGHVPFSGSDAGILRECVLHDEPEPIAGLPDYVNAALLKALSKKREDRYENCKAFIKAMITKPKKSDTESAATEEVSLDGVSQERSAVMNLPSDRPAGEPQPPGWVPQTMFVQPETSIVVQKNTVPLKMPRPAWLMPVLGTAALLVGLIAFASLQSQPKQVAAPPKPMAQKPVETKPVSTPEPVLPELLKPEPGQQPELTADWLKLTNDEKKLLQQKYPELDWADANIIMLPEPTEDALRQAIAQAAKTKENDFIIVRTTKEKHRIVLNNGAFEIRHNAEDKGSVALIALGSEKLILDGNKKDRIFIVENRGTKADFAGIIFTNGFVVDDRGGAVYVKQQSTGRLFHCGVIGNICKAEYKTGWYEGLAGAGIAAHESSLVLRDILFEGNQIDFHDVAGGTEVDGSACAAGLHVYGSIIATDIVFRNNDGGAIFAWTYRDNRLHNISVIGNKTRRGDVVHIMNDHSEQCTFIITNFFAAGNTSSGVYDDYGTLHLRGKGWFLLDHITIVDNSYTTTSSGIVITSKNSRAMPSEVTLSNSIIAGNRRKNSDSDSNFEIRGTNKIGKLNIFNCITSDVSAEFTKERNNLVVSRNDLKLGELNDFGNGVPVMPLLEGSPAIDAGVVTENTPKTDITGNPRNVGKVPDIGAFEWRKNAITAPKEAVVSIEKPAEPAVSATKNEPPPLLTLTAEPIEVTEARQKFEDEVEQAKKPYREELEKERDAAKKRGDLNQVLVLDNELQSLIDLKPTPYKPERRGLDIEKAKHRKRIETVQNTYKKTLSELVKELVRQERIAESKIVKEMIDHFGEPAMGVVIPKRVPRPAVPVVRLTLELAADGKGRFIMEKGLTTDQPTLKFTGTPFPLSAFPKAQAFRGENGLGRVLFDLANTDPMDVWQKSGWCNFTPKTAINLDAKIVQTKDESEVHPSVYFNRKGLKLPCRISNEMILSSDKWVWGNKFVFNTSDSKKIHVINCFIGLGDNSIWGTGYYCYAGQEQRNNIIYFNTSERQVEKTFQFPQEAVAESADLIITAGIPHDQIGISMIDLTATIIPITGLKLSQQGEAVQIDEIDNISSAFRAGLQAGDTIIRFNGMKRTLEQTQKILDDAKFGDPFTVAVLRNGEEKVFRFYAE